MKIKANEKISRLNVNTAPCSQQQMIQLKRGQVVEVDDEAGKTLIRWGLAKKESETKKSKSKEKK